MSQTNAAIDHDVEELVRQFQASDLNELHVRTEGFELYISRDPDAASLWGHGAAASPAVAPSPQPASGAQAGAAPPPAASSAPASAKGVSAPVAVPDGCEVVRAPYLGTFYRAPKPGEPHFVELGQTIEAGTDLCLVEVMKLFTAVRSETRGIIRQILAVDGQMVEEGAPLFALEPLA
jgi:acetyl-CoA carboxylase biotin carboxyl carrier protein